MLAQDSWEQLRDWVDRHRFGKYRGKVVSNEDPTERGRLKVTVAAVLGRLEVWAMPCVPYAGAGVGFYALPEPETGVWIEFEGGDTSHPIWTGCFWADGQIPDAPEAAVKVWRTEKLTLRLDDGGDELTAESTAGARVTVAGSVVAEKGSGKLTVAAGAVTGEAGPRKTELTEGSFSVNGGALEVT